MIISPRRRRKSKSPVKRKSKSLPRRKRSKSPARRRTSKSVSPRYHRSKSPPLPTYPKRSLQEIVYDNRGKVVAVLGGLAGYVGHRYSKSTPYREEEYKPAMPSHIYDDIANRKKMDELYKKRVEERKSELEQMVRQRSMSEPTIMRSTPLKPILKTESSPTSLPKSVSIVTPSEEKAESMIDLPQNRGSNSSSIFSSSSATSQSSSPRSSSSLLDIDTPSPSPQPNRVPPANRSDSWGWYSVPLKYGFSTYRTD